MTKWAQLAAYNKSGKWKEGCRYAQNGDLEALKLRLGRSQTQGSCAQGVENSPN